ncbi:hypothetical protein E4U37_002297 [Claviceps purpurea]|nr:hypothetical protein E4U37_002297 [Claviceps purpurea]
MAKDATIWTIVHAAITGFMVLPIAMVGILTLILARRQGDPARRTFSWLKACHPLLLVSISCIIAADILNVLLFSWQNDAGYYDTVHHTHEEISCIIRSERYLSFTGNLFEHLVDICFVLVLVELGNGLMCSLDGRSRPYQRRLRYAAYVTIIFLASMVLAYFGQPASAWVAYWNGSENNASYAQLIQSLKVVGKLGASFYIPSWGVSICQVVYAAFVLRKHKAGAATRQAAILYLIITILDFIRWIFFVILYSHWILPALDNPWWWNLIDALGNTWIRFVQLCLLLIIGMRRRKGIWTTHQPWMPCDASALASEMDSPHEAGPSPIVPPSTSYSYATWLRKEDSPLPSTPQTWHVPYVMPTWPHPELPAFSRSVIFAPQELDAVQYQYAPHPLLGPGYLVLQSQSQPQPQIPQTPQSQTQLQPQVQVQPQSQVQSQSQSQPQSQPQPQLQPQSQSQPQPQLQPQQQQQQKQQHHQPQPQLPPQMHQSLHSSLHHQHAFHSQQCPFQH